MNAFSPLTEITYLKSRLDAAGAAKVLIVDDQADVQLITRMSLRRIAWQGHPLDLHLANTGQEAVDFVKANPDTQVVIMDIMMEHDRAGLEATEQIHYVNPWVQVVIQTGQAGLLSEQEVIRQYPVVNYLAKSADSAQKIGSMVLLALKNRNRHITDKRIRDAWKALYTDHQSIQAKLTTSESLLHWIHHSIVQGPCALLNQNAAPTKWYSAADATWVEHHRKNKGTELAVCEIQRQQFLFYETEPGLQDVLEHFSNLISNVDIRCA